MQGRVGLAGPTPAEAATCLDTGLSQPSLVPEGRGDARSGPEAAMWGQLSSADEEKVPVPNGSRAKPASFLRSGPATVGGGPMENGSQAPGVFWGELFHLGESFTCVPLAPSASTANFSPSWVWEAGRGWRVGSDGSRGWKQPLLDQLGPGGRTQMGRELGHLGSRRYQLARAMPRPRAWLNEAPSPVWLSKGGAI